MDASSTRTAIRSCRLTAASLPVQRLPRGRRRDEDRQARRLPEQDAPAPQRRPWAHRSRAVVRLRRLLARTGPDDRPPRRDDHRPADAGHHPDLDHQRVADDPPRRGDRRARPPLRRARRLQRRRRRRSRLHDPPGRPLEGCQSLHRRHSPRRRQGRQTPLALPGLPGPPRRRQERRGLGREPPRPLRRHLRPAREGRYQERRSPDRLGLLDSEPREQHRGDDPHARRRPRRGRRRRAQVQGHPGRGQPQPDDPEAPPRDDDGAALPR